MNIGLVIGASVGVLTIFGAVIGFFQMQTRQNMKIEALERAMEDLKRKQSEQSKYQIQTEKAVVEINTKLDSIMETLKELKERK